MPIRNPFRSKPDQVRDENWPPSVDNGSYFTFKSESDSVRPSGSRAASIGAEQQAKEYKLSEIDSRGVYIPPSPTETKSSFWSTRSGASTRTSSHRSELNENEPFSISRESFDSYRRSFDISARSPVIPSSPAYGRASMDARQLRLPSSMQTPSPSASMRRSGSSPDQKPSNAPFQPVPNILPDKYMNPPTAQPDEAENVGAHAAAKGSGPPASGPDTKKVPASEPGTDQFEDVGLGEPAEKTSSFKRQFMSHHQAKKSSLFSRFGSTNNTIPEHSATPPERPGSSGLGLGLGMFGRKRGTSGQGAELGHVQDARPAQAPGKKDGGPGSVSTTEVEAADGLA